MTSVVKEGFVRCVNLAEGCELAGTDRPVEYTLESTHEMATDLPIEVTSTEHAVFMDADLVCPECGHACAALTQPARKIPKMVA